MALRGVFTGDPQEFSFFRGERAQSLPRRRGALGTGGAPVATTQPAGAPVPGVPGQTTTPQELSPIANLFGAINFSVGNKGDTQAPGREFADRAVEKGANLADIVVTRFKRGQKIGGFTGGGNLQPGGGPDPTLPPSTANQILPA